MTANDFQGFDSETILDLAKAYDRALGEADRTSRDGDLERAGAARHRLARDVFSLGRQHAMGMVSRPDTRPRSQQG